MLTPRVVGQTGLIYVPDDAWQVGHPLRWCSMDLTSIRAREINPDVLRASDGTRTHMAFRPRGSQPRMCYQFHHTGEMV